MTYLPGQSVSPVPIHLPVADGQRAQTVAPPQVIAALDDHIPALAGDRGMAQAPHVQLAEDLHAHLCRERLCKVQLCSSMSKAHQGDTFVFNNSGVDVPFRDMLHLSASPYTPLKSCNRELMTQLWWSMTCQLFTPYNKEGGIITIARINRRSYVRSFYSSCGNNRIRSWSNKTN